MRRQRGLSMGVVMACLVVLTLILFSAVSATLSHLSVANRVSQTDHARNLAESAIAETIARLSTNHFQPLSEGRVQVSFEDLPDAEGTVSFLPSEFPEDFSTYRLLDPDRKTSPVGARGRTVPENSVHLVARGRVGDVEQWVECIYQRPPFPEGLISTGPVEAAGLYLTGVALGSAYNGSDPSAMDPNQKWPANLFSNDDSSQSVKLSADCFVNGSVGSVGGIVVEPGSTVAGELSPQAATKEPPELDLAAKMETLTRTAYPVENDGGDVTLVDGWFAHSPHNLNVEGDLDLNGSVICVEGDLLVRGAIKGTGFVLVDGDVTVTDGGSNLTGSDQIALAATGDIRLKAESPEGNYFKGLIYSEGNLETRDITVVGAMVVNGKRGKAGSVLLDNVRFIYDPAGVSLNFRGPQGFYTENKGPKGWVSTAGERTWGFSLAIKPNAALRNTFLVDFDVFMSNAAPTKKQQKKIIKNEPKTWVPDSTNPGGAPAYVVSLRDFLYDPSAQDPLAGLAQELVEMLVAASGPDTNADYIYGVQDALGAELEVALRELPDNKPDNLELTFNLNNLLSEQMSSSRILLWRPWSRS